ncbi:MAG: rod shape-determining protein MreC [Alphaproteobacteria bacterium]|nr:rod shape-determining protein MreC [Alphaproteobacteria bacterium]
MKHRRSLIIHFSRIRLLAKKFVLVILFLAAFVLMLLNKTDNAIIDKTSGVATDVVASVVDVLVLPARLIANGYDFIKNIGNIYADNHQLRLENQRLNMIYNRYKSLEVENKLLASLLNYVTPPKVDFVTAKVVAEEGSAFAHSMVAYVGDTKVEKGQVVLSDKGLVGRVDKVGSNYTKIILITDINSKIPVVVENTRVRGILSGDNTNTPKMIFIPLDADVKVGDRIVTSGVASVFPSGLPIGKVIRVTKNEIMVKPFSDLEQLEYVKIVNYNVVSDTLIQNTETKGKENE